MAEKLRILLVDGHRKQEFYRNLVAELEADWDTVTAPTLLHGSTQAADLVIVNDETWPYCGAALPELRRQGVPTLHLADGILEWNNVWDNPRQKSEEKGMPLFQPVLSDKIACIGRSQARILESWGNLGKCEVTGSPRFDDIRARRQRDQRPHGPCRILIATARTPGFTLAQVTRIASSLADLKRWFETHPSVGGTPVEPVWRITGGLEKTLGVANTGPGLSLAEQLETVDALITSPSTVQLEGMMSGIPVALLDYLNLPQFVPAAWTITAAEHIGEIVPLLLTPDERRMLCQDTILHDSVECRTPAAPRVATLIECMAAAGGESRRHGRPLQMPRRILSDPFDGHHLPEERFRLNVLHPRHPVFAQTDLARLQAEVGHLRLAIRRSPTQIAYRALCECHRMLTDFRSRRTR